MALALALAAAGVPATAAWAAGPPNRNAFPLFRQGDGPRGYGNPDKVIVDVSGWTHPAKAALATLNEAKAVRVEFYKAGTYPVFIVRRAKDSTTFRYLQLHETPMMDRWGKRILKANAGWAFEVIDSETDDRLRANGARAGQGQSVFDLGDTDGFME
ncbi:MAG: hypothetical protein EXR79_17525 [Myxococcales bacterium]|nr:hypothetical protein [Myxococcales bacterium]